MLPLPGFSEILHEWSQQVTPPPSSELAPGSALTLEDNLAARILPLYVSDSCISGHIVSDKDEVISEEPV